LTTGFSPQYNPRAMSELTLSPQEYERLKARLEELERARREVAREIAEAAAQKDLSENAAYHAAKEKQAFLEGEIAQILQKIRTAKVVRPEAGKVGVGSRVRLQHVASEQVFHVLIVSDINHSPDADGEMPVSAGSPLGQALLGRAPGERVQAETPQGTQEYVILEVLSR